MTKVGAAGRRTRCVQQMRVWNLTGGMMRKHRYNIYQGKIKRLEISSFDDRMRSLKL
jgi:hypothetical protein